ncbi:ArsR/SmtB family transcription factor [Limnoglobus roseus]|nr:winged helix-turn-helix transcriptional regulator [Limnoglobus roseus]
MLAAIAEPTRVRIAERLGVNLDNVSHHLGVLKAAGILAGEKRGRHVEYDFAPGVFTPPRKDNDLGTLHFREWRIGIGRTAGFKTLGQPSRRSVRRD